MFRISLGRERLMADVIRPPELAAFCAKISEQLVNLRSMSFSELNAMDTQRTTPVDLESGRAPMTIYREPTGVNTLVVVQGFYPTWWFPTYFSTRGVGKMFVDGFIANADGSYAPAPAETLDIFR